MFVDVVPFIRLPRSQSTFTYSVPEVMKHDVRIGTIVDIEFRKKRTHGCVFRVHTEQPKNYTPLPIAHALPAPRLAPSYCAYLKAVADETWSSPGILFRDVIPIPPKRQKTIAHDSASNRTPRHDHENGTTLLRITTNRTDVQAFLKTYIRAAVHEDGQLLILFPTHEALDDCIHRLEHDGEDHTTIVHTQLSKRAYWEAWQKIIHGARVVMGTRSAVFAPGIWTGIIIVDEENGAFKQGDQTPRYSTHRCVELLRALYGCSVVSMSVAPRVSTWHTVREHHNVPQSHTIIRLLDMRDGRHEHGIFHGETIEAVNRALQQRKPTILFLGRSNYAGSMFCRDCGYLLVCTTCSRPYTVADTLICAICHATRPLPSACPRCRGVFFDVHGFGVERVKKIVRETFGPISEKLITVTANPDHEMDDTAQRMIMSCEALLHHPDFRAGERTYQWLQHIVARSDTPLILQSWSPDHHALRAVVERKPELFYDVELRDREAMCYPPCARSALLIVKTRTHDEASRAVNALLPQLLTACRKAGILTSEPYVRRGASPGVIHTSIYLRHLIERKEEEFTAVLKSIPDAWLIDREPESIF